MSQLSGGLFSSSVVWKKLSHQILFYFLLGMVFSFKGSETHFDFRMVDIDTHENII